MRKMRTTAIALSALAIIASGCGSSKKSTASSSTSAAAAGSSTSAAAGSSSSAAASTSSAAASTSVKATQGGNLTFYMITHGDGGVFWSVVQKGAEAAGKQMGVTVKYEGANNDPQKQAQMIDAAVAEKPAGIAISLANPSALADSVKKAVAAGIPVYSLNSGVNDYLKLGISVHVGQTEIIAGNGAGQRFKAAGAKHLLCVLQEQSNVALEERCKGATDTFGGTVDKLVQTEGDKNQQKSTQEITAKLQADPSIDAILGEGPVVGIEAVDAVKTANSKAIIGAFDLSPDLLQDIKDGKIAFAIDQQQYLQGYLPIVLMYLQATNLNIAGGGQPILTGPGFVTKDNADQVAALSKAGTR
jgi:simple sugar transport system substrate-binding protein